MENRPEGLVPMLEAARAAGATQRELLMLEHHQIVSPFRTITGRRLYSQSDILRARLGLERFRSDSR